MNARWRAPAGLHTASARLPVEGELPSFSGATGWLNSPPPTPASLRGKVTLVDFGAWPALYFADAQGHIRHHHFGESEYQQSEMVIQQLLAEAGSDDISHDPVPVDACGVEAPANWASLESPETYTGYERTENFASPSGVLPGRRHAYATPAELGLNHWALSGDWTMEEQAATANEADGQIAYRFHARDLNLVMGPATPGTSVRFRCS